MVSVTPPNQIADVIASLTNPSPQRMLYQDTVLHDKLVRCTPARDRLRALMLAMAAIGRRRCVHDEPLQLPCRILECNHYGPHIPDKSHDLAALYSDHPALQERCLRALQTEVGHLRRELARVRIDHQHALNRTQETVRTIESSLI